MAKTKELTVSIGRVVSDGNYGSIKCEVTETVTLSSKDDSRDVFQRLTSRVKNRVLKLKKEITSG